MAQGIPARLTSAEGRRFALTVGTAFEILSAVMLWRDHGVLVLVFGGLGVVLIAAGLVIPGSLGPVYRAWMALAQAISRVTTPIFMAAVFFLVITPVGLWMRVLGRNPIRHPAVNESYWAPRSELRGTLSNQF